MRRVLDLLGLARRAGHVIAGTEAVRDALQVRRLALVIVAEDASPTQRRKVVPKAAHRRVPLLEVGTREALGRALGRAPVSVVAVTDARLAAAVHAAVQQSRQTDEERASGWRESTN